MNECSSQIENKLGVPQGSILGPLLFILYINDICQVVKHCVVKLFADDTSIYICGKNISQMVQQLNEDLNSIFNWLQHNKMKINISKTVYMEISNKTKSSSQDKEIIIGGQIIKKVKEAKYLGIVIDDKLKFSKNVDYIIKKMAKKVSFLGRIKRQLSINMRLKLYKTLIAPHVDYCSTILFLCNKTHIQKLQKVQNRALRIILDAKWDTSIKRMLVKLNLSSVTQRINFNIVIFIFKIKSNMLPKYLKNKMKRVNEVHSKHLRRNHHFRLPQYRKTSSQRSLYYNGLKIFNKLPEELKEIKTINKFKSEVIVYIRKIF